MRGTSKNLRILLFYICIIGCCKLVEESGRSSINSSNNGFFAEAFSLEPVSLVVGKPTRRSFLSIARRTNCKSTTTTSSNRIRSSSSNSSSSSQIFASNDDDDAATKALQEKAAALRREVEAFEASKQEESDRLQQKIDGQQREKDELRLRYSAVVPILKGDGTVSMERCDFPPRMTTEIPEGETNAGNERTTTEPQRMSRIVAFRAPLPLGIVLGQDEELPVASRPTTVDAVAEGGNAQKAGVKVGDCLRGCTACQVTMEQPTWQLLAGGIGRPKTTRMMFGTDNKTFEQVMDAIASNAMDTESRDVWLVVERMDHGEEENNES